VTGTKADIEAMAKQIRYDLSVTRTRIDELMEAVASLPIPQAPTEFYCPDCRDLPFASQRRLLMHRESVHGELADRSDVDAAP
jgi:hypothetical protein